MLCPVCRTELQMSERQHIEIDYCPQCRGIWLDRGELDKIIERTIAAEQNEIRGLPANTANHTAPPAQREYDDDDDHRERSQRGYAPPPAGYNAPPPGYAPPSGYAPPQYGHGHPSQGHYGHHKRKKKKHFLEDLFDFD